MKSFLKIFFPLLAVYLGIVFSAYAAPVSNLFRNIAPETDLRYDNGTSTFQWLNLFTKYASTTALSVSSGTATTTLTSATSTFNGVQLTGGCFLAIDGTCLGAGTGITSLNGLSGSSQTFSANGPLVITSAGTVHTFNASSSPWFGGLTASSTAHINTLNLDNVLTVVNGGTASSTLGGLLYGNGTALGSVTVSSPLTYAQVSGTLACATCLTAAVTSLNGLSGASQTFSTNGYLGITSAGTVHTFNGTTSPFFGTLFATSTVRLGNLTTGLVLSGSTGILSNYAGTSCSNEFPRSLDASGAATCAGVGTLDVSGLDISDDTNLAVVSGGLLYLNGDTLFASSSPLFGSVTATSTVHANSLTLDTDLTVSNGGTGIGLYTPGDMLFAKTPTSFATIASSTDGFVLMMSNGTPTWSATTSASGITSLNGLSGTSQTFSANGPLAIVSAGTVHTFNASSSPYFGTLIATSSAKFTSDFTITGLTSALVLTGAGGLLAEYTGTSCSNTFTRSLSALGVATCETVDISADTNLSVAGNGLLSLSGDTLTASSSPTFGTVNATGTVNLLASTLLIPNSIDPTVNATGQLVINSTSTAPALNFYVGATKRVLNTKKNFTIVWSHTGQSGTSTNLFANLEHPITIAGLYCKTALVATSTFDLDDGTNATDSLQCHRRGTSDDGSIANATFNKREDIQLNIGSMIGTPGTTTISGSYYETD